MNIKRLEELAKPRSEAAINAAERRKQHREYHNTDIAACTNEQCKLNTKCLRWHLAKNMDTYQVYAIFNPNSDDDCDNLIETKRYESKG